MLGEALHSGCQVHAVSHHGALEMVRIADRAEDYLPAMQAHAKAQLREIRTAIEVVGFESTAHGDGATQRIIGLLREQGEDTVAVVLPYESAVRSDARLNMR